MYLSMFEQQQQNIQGMPSCPCCGLDMDEWGLTFAGKVTVRGKNYFCNNPMCLCEYEHKTD
jgi:hypothetical protein